MNANARTAAITGAYGYLGALIRAKLEAQGWNTVALVRRPRADDRDAEHFDLDGSPPTATLRSVDLLVHCAYDATLVRRADIERVNVDGSRRLFRAAREVEVGRLIVVSSMSAYPGTVQTYGRAKLAIEAAAQEAHGCCVRPGVVYGPHAGGMAGALRKLTKLPVVPVLADRYRQYFVHEDDVASAISALAEACTVGTGPITIADPTPVSMREFLTGMARLEGRDCRFRTVPWQAAYSALRFGELLRLKLPFRSDSLLGLVKTAPALVGVDTLAELGIRPRPFERAPTPPS